MTYRPTFRRQLDGSACQSTNCGPASQAMAAERHRLGVDPRNAHGWPPTPTEIRRWLGSCGPSNLRENAGAASGLYGVTMWVRYGVPWDTFRSLIVSGRGAIVQIGYSAVHETAFDACPTFTGAHAIYVNERRASDGAYLVSDPLADGRRAGIPKGPQWWPGTLLRRAAEAMPGTATGCINASFTRDTE